MKEQMTLKVEISKADSRPLAFIARREGTREIRTKDEESKRGKGRVRRIEAKRTKAILIIANYFFSTGPPPYVNKNLSGLADLLATGLSVGEIAAYEISLGEKDRPFAHYND
jgi:hypothetical protein